MQTRINRLFHRRRIPHVLTLVALTAIAGTWLACQKPMAKPMAEPKSAHIPAPTPPFTLTLSSGGGFSGGVEGYTLTSQGEIKAWQKQLGQPETTLWSFQDKPDSALALYAALQPFLSVSLQETGNRTTRIRLVLPDSTYIWSKSGNGVSEEAPEPFRTWYARANAYCEALGQNESQNLNTPSKPQ